MEKTEGLYGYFRGLKKGEFKGDCTNQIAKHEESETGRTFTLQPPEPSTSRFLRELLQQQAEEEAAKSARKKQLADQQRAERRSQKGHYRG